MSWGVGDPGDTRSQRITAPAFQFGNDPDLAKKKGTEKKEKQEKTGEEAEGRETTEGEKRKEREGEAVEGRWRLRAGPVLDGWGVRPGPLDLVYANGRVHVY